GMKDEVLVALWRATDDRPKWSASQMEAEIIGWVKQGSPPVYSGSVPVDTTIGILLDKSCFYAVSGGQVGDKGTITTPTGVFAVEYTFKEGNSVIHLGKVAAGKIDTGQKARLQVSPEREFTRKNHTATHLLHWALHQVLGEHVEQRRSKVKPDEF